MHVVKDSPVSYDSVPLHHLSITRGTREVEGELLPLYFLVFDGKVLGRDLSPEDVGETIIQALLEEEFE